jgi:FHA domain-containing protein
MTLVLQGIALNDEPMSQPLIGRFDERGGTLGRSENATFTLPDPERLISRVQAQILFQDEGYWIENVSAANSTLHNGRPLSAGMRILLREGDELRIGGYTLIAAFENDEVSATILRGRTLVIQRPGPLIAPNVAPATTQKPSSPAESLPSSQPPAASSLMPNNAPTPAVPVGAPADGQPSAKPAGAHKPVNDEPPWSERTQPPGPLTASKVASAAEQEPSIPAEALPTPQPPAFSSVPAHNAPTPAVPVGSNGQPSAKAAGAHTPLSDDSLWRAFLEGAGIELPNSLSPEFMRQVGTLLRVAIEGIHRLVTMRATAKEEMHAEMTRIQVRGNDPLKFAPDGTVALQFLLQPPIRGFLPGPTALRETMIDLQSHQVGMTAGMLSAMEAVLDRFDPSKVEALLTTRSVFDSLLPTYRRARLWELYVEHYRSLREETQDDFKRLFGEAFREAYEAQGRSPDAAHDGSIPPEPNPWRGAK